MTNLTKTAAMKELTTYARENGMTFKKVGNEYQLLNRKTKSILYKSIGLWTAYNNMQNGYFYKLAEKDGAVANVQTSSEKAIISANEELNEIIYDSSWDMLEKEIDFQLGECSWDNDDVNYYKEKVEDLQEKICDKFLSFERKHKDLSVIKALKSKALDVIFSKRNKLNDLIDELTKENEM